MTPTDDLAFVGDPPLFRPQADEVHVSVSFTWDIEKGKKLRDAWATHYPVVKLGGPAFGTMIDPYFHAGMYVKPGVTFTSRGCYNDCPWCLVPHREGSLFEIPYFEPGYIIQDNNLLQCRAAHIDDVFKMLKTQRAAVFSGGIDATLVDHFFRDRLRMIKVNSIFLAADTKQSLRPLERSLEFLKEFGRNKLRVYCMIGRNETIKEATERLQAIWDLGGLPFAQLYQPPDQFIKYSYDWKDLARTWSRPAVMYAAMKMREIEKKQGGKYYE